MLVELAQQRAGADAGRRGDVGQCDLGLCMGVDVVECAAHAARRRGRRAGAGQRHGAGLLLDHQNEADHLHPAFNITRVAAAGWPALSTSAVCVAITRRRCASGWRNTLAKRGVPGRAPGASSAPQPQQLLLGQREFEEVRTHRELRAFHLGRVDERLRRRAPRVRRRPGSRASCRPAAGPPNRARRWRPGAARARPARNWSAPRP